jgi:hypothetical protein
VVGSGEAVVETGAGAPAHAAAPPGAHTEDGQHANWEPLLL